MKAKPARNSSGVVLELGRRDESLLAAASKPATQTPSAFRLKRILVPIDFSDCSRKALRYAIPLAREHAGAITLLYVVPPAYASGEYGGIDYALLQAQMRESGAKELSRLAIDEVQAQVPADSLVRLGAPAVEIVAVAGELDIDAIVIGTHGRTGLKHVMLGSVAESVVRRAPCPVLVVKEREHEFLAR